MNDRPLLILTALISAAVAWGFRYYVGSAAFDVLLMVALLCAIGDNRRLRRKLRHLEMEDGKPGR